jgi:pyrroline-5-carboxylate reductase
MAVATEQADLSSLTVGFVGVGTINSACVYGLCTCGTPPKAVVLSPRNAEKATALAAQWPDLVTVLDSAQAVLDCADWVFVATPPGPANAAAVLGPLRFKPAHTVVCLISGVAPEAVGALVAPAGTLVQAFPLPPAAVHRSTTVMWPKNARVQSVLARLGGVVPVDNFREAMTLGAVSCTMGDFYAHLRATHQWLTANGIGDSTASAAIGSYFATFHAASERACPAGFDHLVAEQTPGGMNEQVMAQLAEMGNYDNVKVALDTILPRLLGSKL